MADDNTPSTEERTAHRAAIRSPQLRLLAIAGGIVLVIGIGVLVWSRRASGSTTGTSDVNGDNAGNEFINVENNYPVIATGATSSPLAPTSPPVPAPGAPPVAMKPPTLPGPGVGVKPPTRRPPAPPRQAPPGVPVHHAPSPTIPPAVHRKATAPNHPPRRVIRHGGFNLGRFGF